MAKIAQLSLWFICCSLLILTVAGCTILTGKSPQHNPLIIRVSPPVTPVTPSKTSRITYPSPELPMEPSSTPILSSPTPALPTVLGSLRDIIVQLEAGAPRQDSDGFVQPDVSALVDFTRLVDHLLNGNLLAAAEISMRYGYELVNYRDQQTPSSEYLLLREIKSSQRGWGVFIISLDACRDPSRVLIVEAPHILSDEGTPQIALDTFRALHGCALMVAGAHRDANSDGSADVAHNPKTIFQSMQNAIATAAGPATLVLQIHGFAAEKHPGYPSIVLGDNSTTDLAGTALLTALSHSLEEHGISTGVCDGVNWTDLCGETNVLANNLPAGLFIHLEMDEQARLKQRSAINSLVDVIYGK